MSYAQWSLLTNSNVISKVLYLTSSLLLNTYGTDIIKGLKSDKIIVKIHKGVALTRRSLITLGIIGDACRHFLCMLFSFSLYRGVYDCVFRSAVLGY